MKPKKKKGNKMFEWMSMDEFFTRYKNPDIAYPEEFLLNQNVQYFGPEEIKVSYVVDRMPRAYPEVHPIIQEERLRDNERVYKTARTTHPNWDVFYQAVMDSKKKMEEKGSAGGKKKESSSTTGGNVPPVAIPEEFEPTPEIIMKYGRNFGKEESTMQHEHILRTYNPLPRYTIDDLNDERHSPNRRLSDRLYFIVKEKDTGIWKFPDGIRENPYSLKEACFRRYWEDMHSTMLTWFVANHPISVYVNPLNHLQRTYFFHCLYVSGLPRFEFLEQFDDFQWITREEVKDYQFIDEKYKEIAYDMLLDGMIKPKEF